MTEDKAQLHRQLTRLQKNLQALQERRGSLGPAAPPHLSDQIRRAKAEIAQVETRLAAMTGPEAARPAAPAGTVVADVNSPRALAANTLRLLDELLDDLTAELDSMPAGTRPAAESMLAEARRARQQLSPDKAPETMQSRVDQLEQPLRYLKQRRVQRRRLAVMREKLAAAAQTLDPAALAQKVQPRISAEEAAIAELEATILPPPRNALEAKVQEVQRTQHIKLLAGHRRDLEFYREMLAGQRPFAPVDLLNSIADTEAEIAAIDERLQSTGYKPDKEKTP
jgi:hypothetical protein